MSHAFSKILILAIFAVLIAGGFSAWQYFGVEEEKTQTGTIEGSLSYPSDFIPSDMKVCAEDIATKKEYCTETHIKNSKYTYGEGYKIEVPSGSYYVFATTQRMGDYKAYYSEFVICGLKAECLSHEPILVKVEESRLVSGIDPIDWYKPLEEVQVETEKPYIKVISPNGGERYVEGEIIKIRWESRGIEKVDIVYNVAKGWVVVSDYPAEVGEYLWTPQTILEQYSNFVGENLSRVDLKITIFERKTDGTLGTQDSSDNYFNVVSPNESANWKTYTNEEYGFEIKYPKEFTQVEATSPEEPIGGIIITILPNGWYKFYARKTFWGEPDLCRPSSFDPLPTSQTKKTIGGVLFTRYETEWFVGELLRQVLVNYCGIQGDVYYFLQYVQTIRKVLDPFSFEEEPALGEELITSSQLQDKIAQFEEIVSTFKHLNR